MRSAIAKAHVETRLRVMRAEQYIEERRAVLSSISEHKGRAEGAKMNTGGREKGPRKSVKFVLNTQA